MKKFGRPMGPQPKKPKGKGGGQAMLPNRAAVTQLTKGDPTQQSLGNYAKLTPSGASAPSSYPAIMAEGDQGVSAAPDETS
jgi:hypothetical protein